MPADLQDSPSLDAPFAAFARGVQRQDGTRAAITQATRRPEPECLPPLIALAVLPEAEAAQAQRLARQLVEALRGKKRRSAVEGLVQEFSLSSQEGVALMCLAEALLRIPDAATRDALIRDKLSAGDWRSHVGHSPSLFVNAATWGLVVTGKLTASHDEAGLAGALTRLIARGGEPVIRKAVDRAMRMMGEQFVTGQTIRGALANSRAMEARGFRYSYDMLGEAAVTAADAARYLADYEAAIHAIGAAAAGRGIHDGPGISIKLSALHPRYARSQRGRVMAELLPRLRSLAALAQGYGIGLNIDAEEADRLDLSLDLLEALCADPAHGWDGLGFVVQAYQKRAPSVLRHLIGLARRHGRRLMVRLVKGAYWDSEIKRAQVDGLPGYPVFTRKLHTDVSYLACARLLLDAPDAAFPQFATHNARTLAAIHAMAGPDFHPGQYEFQCLHGMGEALYEEVVGPAKLGRPCRIYAPVGTHETLLAYLVRRLLENGANSSFVNRIADPAVSIEDLVADPVEQARAAEPVGAPHPRIALPGAMFGAERANSAGLDLSDESRLGELADALLRDAGPWRAAGQRDGKARGIRNPADRRDLVGEVADATPATVDEAVAQAVAAAPGWAATSPAERAACLDRAAGLLEQRRAPLLGLIVREAGKSLPNAVGEVREAVDFLRYYAAQIRAGFDNATHRPLGPVACISPWNFPLAIFTGQVAAALAAGNPVLAKPAEETPLVAAEAVRLLRQAGVPDAALQLLPGAGEVGAALAAHPAVAGVMFTGSDAVARAINRTLARRLGPTGRPAPLVAETGGLNAMVVDSSALAEQVVADVIASAFDSAGQRCSALRLLCVQQDAADRILAMLKGAMAELAVGDPGRLATDIGPVITEEARQSIEDYVAAMRAKGCAVHAAPLPESCRHGAFVAPTLIEVGAVSDLEREVFGPVLHVLRFRRDGIDALMDQINATGYGLTFGVHSRLDETVARLAGRSAAGNIYVNRNVIGAVVGVQPFGGHGLSGAGPKAGGPLYLRRLLESCPAETGLPASIDLPGPAGERNAYSLHPRGAVLCVPATPAGLAQQLAAAAAAGNTARVRAPASLLAAMPGQALPDDGSPPAAVLFEGSGEALLALLDEMAARDGPIVPVLTASGAPGYYPPEMLVRERSVATNTAAAGGNASLMSLG